MVTVVLVTMEILTVMTMVLVMVKAMVIGWCFVNGNGDHGVG